MAIAFLCNKDLTVPFEAHARFMRDAGEEIVWLSPTTRWTKWLVSRGWERESILNIAERRLEWAAKPEAESRAFARAPMSATRRRPQSTSPACAAA